MSKNKFIIYLSSEKRFSEHTVKSYTTDLNQFTTFLADEFQITDDIDEVRFQIIRTWIASLLEKGVNPRSVNRKISTLKSYFKFLIREGVIVENPMMKVVAPKSKKRLPVFIEEDQIESLLNEVQFEGGFIGERNKLIIELFYVTGIRLSELINIKISDIDFQNQLIKVLGKRNKERLIPLSSSVLVGLSNFIEKNQQNQFLFTNLDGKKLYTKLVYRLVNKCIGEISSVNKKSPHILRHTFATHMLNNGADINAIKELLGHANLSATQVYTHNTIEKLKTVYKQAHPRA
ncbi:MAG: tyrosine-type recombinase/integrase [Flavobacteriales bacterium]|nr:tyrosine-type recombinase/integrase [Flavobacteriales bacterium]MDG1348930.1 tyrosine-type recombinase/integrase [Flavobacteriales bacterium]|tara:strand:- start:421 stop:1290 length:870 start_codon:yes stop_codon:yes gene_type:complete